LVSSFLLLSGSSGEAELMGIPADQGPATGPAWPAPETLEELETKKVTVHITDLPDKTSKAPASTQLDAMAVEGETEQPAAPGPPEEEHHFPECASSLLPDQMMHPASTETGEGGAKQPEPDVEMEDDPGHKMIVFGPKTELMQKSDDMLRELDAVDARQKGVPTTLHELLSLNSEEAAAAVWDFVDVFAGSLMEEIKKHPSLHDFFDSKSASDPTFNAEEFGETNSLKDIKKFVTWIWQQPKPEQPGHLSRLKVAL
jgi:hypothetical protein